MGVCARMRARVCVQPVPVFGAGEGVEKAMVGSPQNNKYTISPWPVCPAPLYATENNFLPCSLLAQAPFSGAWCTLWLKVHTVKWGRDSLGNGGATDPGAFRHPNSWPGQEIGSECFLREPGQAEVSSVCLGDCCNWNFVHWQPNEHAFHKLPKTSFYLKMY